MVLHGVLSLYLLLCLCVCIYVNDKAVRLLNTEKKQTQKNPDQMNDTIHYLNVVKRESIFSKWCAHFPKRFSHEKTPNTHTHTLAHSKDSDFWLVFFFIQNIDVIALQKANQSWYYQLCCVCVWLSSHFRFLCCSPNNVLYYVYNFQVCNSSFVMFFAFPLGCLPFYCWSDKTIRCELKSSFHSIIYM